MHESAAATSKPSDQRFERERDLEGSILALARAHRGGIDTIDLMEFVRDVVDAADACRVEGTSQQSVASIIEDTFGAIADKEEDRAAKKR